MFTIWKYRVPTLGYFELTMPQNARILSCQVQHGEPQIWAVVNPEETISDKRLFRVVGTGHPLEDNFEDLSFIGTFQLQNGLFIAHLFEIDPPTPRPKELELN